MSRQRSTEQQQQKLKDQFGSSFILAVNAFFNVDCKTEKQAYETFLDKHNYKTEKRKFWEVFSSIIDIPIKVLHDHFHNVYTKQFCDSFDDIRLDLIEIIQQHQNEDTKDVIQIMKEQFPNRIFHYQTLYQFTNYYLKKRVSKKQITNRQGKQNSTQNIEANTSQSSDVLLKDKKNIQLQVTIDNSSQQQQLEKQPSVTMFPFQNLPTPKLFSNTVEQNTIADDDIQLYNIKDLVSYKSATIQNLLE